MMLLMLFMAGSSVELQAQNEDSRSERMQKMTKQRVEALAKELKLDKEKTATFVSLCTEYYTKQMELRNMSKPADGAKRTESKVTDEQADALITKALETEQKEVELKKEYYAKMKKEFTASQLLKVFAPQRRTRMPNGGQRQPRPDFGRNNGNFNGGGGFGGDF